MPVVVLAVLAEYWISHRRLQRKLPQEPVGADGSSPLPVAFAVAFTENSPLFRNVAPAAPEAAL